MKKVFVLVLISVLCDCCGYSQKFDWGIGEKLPDGWTATFKESDELKGTDSYVSYSFKSETGTFVFWSNKPSSFRVVAKEGVFPTFNLFGFDFVKAIYGFYDKDGKLVFKDVISLDFDIDQPNVAYASDWRKSKKEKKMKENILNYLVNGEGTLRFLVEKYGGGEVEIKMPCMNK